MERFSIKIRNSARIIFESPEYRNLIRIAPYLIPCFKWKFQTKLLFTRKKSRKMQFETTQVFKF